MNDSRTPPSMERVRELVDDHQRTIVGIGDLKKIIGACAAGVVAALLAVCRYYSNQLEIRANADAKQDVKIQQLEDHSSEFRRTSDRIEQAIQYQQKLQSETLLQMSNLSGKVAATEEIAKSTRDRVEALLDYVRKENRNAVISTEDSVYGPRNITR